MHKEDLRILRERYPVGSRVQLDYMEDVKAPPVGTTGTVRAVDDIGTIHIVWDTGSTLGVVYGVDICHII